MLILNLYLHHKFIIVLAYNNLVKINFCASLNLYKVFKNIIVSYYIFHK